MPRIEFEPKLDFKDVLLRPKRSTLRSRADVDLTREYIFRNSKKTYTGVPIMASNMDTVGTFEMALELAKSDMFTIVHKHYTLNEWLNFAETTDQQVRKKTYSIAGISSDEFSKLSSICDHLPQVHYLCLDVANGYSEHFVDFIRKVRETFPYKTIFAGNVVTGEMVEELILTGADVVKVAEYRASEGKTVTIPYRGDVNCTVSDILGGIRSACTYIGALKLKELSKRATFIRVTHQVNEIFTPFETE